MRLWPVFVVMVTVDGVVVAALFFLSNIVSILSWVVEGFFLAAEAPFFFFVVFLLRLIHGSVYLETFFLMGQVTTNHFLSSNKTSEPCKRKTAYGV